jgi:uncharacterized protein (TIGR00369 family)
VIEDAVMIHPTPSWVRRGFTPADPGFARRMTVDDGAGRALGMLRVTMDAFGPGWAQLRLPFRAEVTNEAGIMHGGMIGFLADDAAGFAAYSLLPKGQSTRTIEYKINFLAPVTGGALVARAQVVRAGRTVAVVEVELVMDGDDPERAVAVALVTMMRVADES